jgi:hypothetical protein
MGAAEAPLISGQRISLRVLRRAAGFAHAGPLAEVKGAAGELVGAGHRMHLEAQMDTLRMAIELERRSDFGDLSDDDQPNRASFLAHFAGLDTALDEWDIVVERDQAAPGSVWKWFAQATSERGFTEPTFAVGQLIDRLATLTVERARSGLLRKRHRLELQIFKTRSPQGEHLSVHVEGQNVAQLPLESAAAVEEQIEACGQRIQALFDDAQRCAEAREVSRASNKLSLIKQPLLERLALHASVEPIAFAAGCPICQRGVRLAASARCRISQDSGAARPEPDLTPASERFELVA